jgi:hypothetical protein
MLLDIAERIGRKKYSDGDVIIIRSGSFWKAMFEPVGVQANESDIKQLTAYPTLGRALLNLIYDEMEK